ncbi:MAG: Gfo/Idh/MocA family oxidoreductase [Isosphaeraceae bacterium]|nr:Gfo/Idh/MocA family oxidoreductase [Isosphaeraceae bacterium]
MSPRRATNRREFLQRSTWVGAGLWVVGSRVLADDQSPNEKLSIGIIGAGGRGEANLRAVSGEEIVALCDIDEQRLGKAAESFPAAKTYHDFRKLLEQKGLDAVVVSTPDHTHAVATVLALRLGKHVYCEKPLTHSIHEARTVARAAAEAKVATQMGNAGHSGETSRRVVELLRAGAIGPVREVHAWTNRPIWPQGIDRPRETPPVPAHVHWDLWLGPAPERPYHPAYHPFKWRGWWDFGTGALGDMGCHVLDPAYWALDLRDPASIEAESPPIHPETAPPWSIIRYTFPARGDRPAVTLLWYDGGKLPPSDLFDGQPPAPGSSGSLFVGTKGRLLVHHGRGGYKLLPEKDYADYQPPEPTLPRPRGHHQEWIEACKTGRPTGTSFDYSGPLTELVLLGNVALRAGRKIDWDAPNMRSKDGSLDDLYIRREYRKGWSL